MRVPCTWKVTGHSSGPYGRCMGSVLIKAPDPDSALDIATKNLLMYDFIRVEHVLGQPGHVGDTPPSK